MSPAYTAGAAFWECPQKPNRLTDDWSLSGTTRFATGFPVTLFDNSDNSLLGHARQWRQQLPARHSRNIYRASPDQHQRTQSAARPSTRLSSLKKILGQLGNAKRRIFYGPGINNFDATLDKNLRLAEAKSLEFRLEAFNVFNHAQFYGPASVEGQIEDPNFGQIVSAAPPRLLQLAAKFVF